MRHSCKHTSKHRHSRRCGHSRRHMKGGSGAYSSASTFGEYVNGPGPAQFSRVFDQAGPYGQVSGNTLIGAQGQNVPVASQMPSAAQLALVQGGGRRRYKKSHSKRGGFLGVVNQAIVPFSLVALNHMYKGKRPQHKSRRYRSQRRH
jgi:hypothetical protein